MIRFKTKKDDKRITIRFENIANGSLFIAKPNNLALKYSNSHAWVFFADTQGNATISSIPFEKYDEIVAFVVREPEINLAISNQPKSFGSTSKGDIFFYKGCYYVKHSETDAYQFALPFFSEEMQENAGAMSFFNTYDAVYPVAMTVTILED